MAAKRNQPKQNDTSVRTYFSREALEVCLVLAGLAIAQWLTHVPWWLWILLPCGKLLISIAFYLLFVKKVFKQRPRYGPWSLIGREAKTLVPLRPEGQVKLDNEIWSATSQDGSPIAAGKDVVIRDVRGSRLLVALRDNT